MPLFSVNKEKLSLVKEQKFSLERDVQRLTEQNLQEVFGLSFVSSEFALNNLRIDTLAFDEETRSFVIIEFKRDRSFSVVDQGFAYLALMLNNKADFILEYNEKGPKRIKREDVDWSQSRVLFIANSFTAYQQEAINFKDLPIELWEAKRYDNSMVLYNQIKAAKTTESIKTISPSETVQRVSREVRSYSIDDHFKPSWEVSRELFDALRPRILELDSRINEKSNKFYIGYKIGFNNICGVNIQKSGLKIDLVRVEKKDLKDPDKKLINVPWKERGWAKTTTFYITSLEDLDYAMFLIRQAYEKFYK
ncbi:MAG TPA: DUF5655 domain-containing protein [Candidatus Saccharimonadia bacterium]|nr:DUF5655 domain-containing protein [Candidatus Saccharimonadia bacterium]